MGKVYRVLEVPASHWGESVGEVSPAAYWQTS